MGKELKASPSSTRLEDGRRQKSSILMGKQCYGFCIGKLEVGNGSQRIHCQRQSPRTHIFQRLVSVIQRRGGYETIKHMTGPGVFLMITSNIFPLFSHTTFFPFYHWILSTFLYFFRLQCPPYTFKYTYTLLLIFFK